MKRRGSGVLLHVTSLPSPFGIGDLGPEAYAFVDFLAEAGQSYWQILPLNPTETFYYSSPYQSISAFAFNLLLISPERLFEQGLITRNDLEPVLSGSPSRINFKPVTEYKRFLLCKAFACFKRNKDYEYARFCSEESFWLDDFALFVALKGIFEGRMWSEWPPEIRHRSPEALQAARERHSEAIEQTKFIQYIFLRQWNALKRYCHEKGIQILGDLPIYVQYDSVDVWTHPRIFKLDENQRPYAVAGVPPDYFSATGQLWGNPVYHWDVLQEQRYDWWIDRLRHNLKLFDYVRIDHFRGLVAYWEVPAEESNAINGKWIEAPIRDFLKQLQKQFPVLPIIAEDLGVITPEVREVMSLFELPGMRILMFAFGGDLGTHPYIPHNLEKNCIAYTGTHDNNTVRGSMENEASTEEKARVFQYLGREVRLETIHWELIRILMMSPANTVILPVQDILGLGGTARMNRPATLDGNWEWRLKPGELTPEVCKTLREMTEIYGRA